MASGSEGVKRYPCILCGQEGLTEHQMKAHIALEHFESDAACPFCDARCQSPARLVRHINKKHPEIFRSSGPHEDRNLSAFKHGMGRRAKHVQSTERCTRDEADDDDSSDETSRLDPVGVPVAAHLNTLQINNGCNHTQEDGQDSLSDSSLNTEEVNKLMIGKIRASSITGQSRRSGMTLSDPCACRGRGNEAAPGRYFFERDRSPAREKTMPCEGKENQGILRKCHKSVTCKSNLNVSDDSESEEQTRMMHRAFHQQRRSCGSDEEMNVPIDKGKRPHRRDNQSTSDVRQPPFGGERGCRREKVRQETSELYRVEHNRRPSSPCTPPCSKNSHPKEFNCPICPFATDCRQTIIAHVQDMHAEELDGKQDSGNACPICKRKFPSPETLQSHVHSAHRDVLKTPESKRKRSEGNSLPGPQQGIYHGELEAATVSELSQRQSSSGSSNSKSSRELLMACQLCGVMVANREELLQHMAWTHPQHRAPAASLSQKTYCCLLCDSEFGSRELLHTHVQEVHAANSSARPTLEHHEAAPQPASQPSSQKPSGARHSHGRDSNQPLHNPPPKDADFVCAQCGAKFYARDDFMRHMVWVHDGGPSRQDWMCNQCKAHFSSEIELKHHVEAVHFPNARPSLRQSRNVAMPDSPISSNLEAPVLQDSSSSSQGKHHRSHSKRHRSKGSYRGVHGGYQGAQASSGRSQGSYGGSQGRFGGSHGNPGGSQGSYGGSQGSYGGSQGRFGGSHGNPGGIQGNPGGFEVESRGSQGGSLGSKSRSGTSHQGRFGGPEATRGGFEVESRGFQGGSPGAKSRPSGSSQGRPHGSQQGRPVSSGNTSTSNYQPASKSSAEIPDATCPVCQKVLPNVSMAGLQAHIDSHFPEDRQAQAEATTSGLGSARSSCRSKDSWSTKRYNSMIAHMRGPVEVDQQRYQHHCFPHSKEPGRDDGISMTEGIIERLQEYYRPSMPDNVAHVWLCAPISHFASTAADRGWGCGYRNFQMMISCLIDRREYYAALLQDGEKKAEGGAPPTAIPPRPGYMPSIGRIQTMLEEAWQDGFDPEGRDQLGGQIFDTCKWIGATELVAILTHCGIKTKLVDFPQPSAPDGTHPALFKWVLNYFSTPSTQVRPPLYLQHQGHSRTIVGIEQLQSSELRLLVFDPGKDIRHMDRFKWNLNKSTVNTMRRGLHSLKARQYQILSLDGFLTESEREAGKVIRSERIM